MEKILNNKIVSKDKDLLFKKALLSIDKLFESELPPKIIIEIFEQLKKEIDLRVSLLDKEQEEE